MLPLFGPCFYLNIFKGGRISDLKTVGVKNSFQGRNPITTKGGSI